MNVYFKRIASCLVACVMLCSFTVPVYAEETIVIDYDSTEEGSNPSTIQDVSVDVEMAETYSVVLPKSITLDGSNSNTSYEYNIEVSGIIGEGRYVRVIPLDGATLTNGISVKDLEITQDKRRFTAEEASLITSTTGTMSVDGLTPGAWSGTVQFKVMLDDGAEWNAATCITPATRIGVDIDDNGVIDESEKDISAVTRGVSLGHKFNEGETAFPATCLRCSKPVYGITNVTQLETFRDNVNNGNAYTDATVELLSDVDLSGVSWTPIDGFAGNFDGHNHKITNMKITSIDDDIGLFSSLSDVQIKNLVLQNPTITGTYASNGGTLNAGFIVGMARNTNISNVHVRDAVINVSGMGRFNLGGIVGNVDSGFNFVASNVSVIGSFASDGRQYSGDANLGGIGIGGVINNSFVAVSMVASDANSMTSFGFNASVSNCVYDNEVCTVSTTGNGMDTAQADSGMSTNDIKNTTSAIDVLNTDNEMTWELDLLNVNNGYPVIKE